MIVRAPKAGFVKILVPSGTTASAEQPLAEFDRYVEELELVRIDHAMQQLRAFERVLDSIDDDVVRNDPIRIAPDGEPYAARAQARAELLAAVEIEQLSVKLLQAMNERFRVGEVTRSDVSEAEAVLARHRSQRAVLELSVAEMDQAIIANRATIALLLDYHRLLEEKQRDFMNRLVVRSPASMKVTYEGSDEKHVLQGDELMKLERQP